MEDVRKKLLLSVTTTLQHKIRWNFFHDGSKPILMVSTSGFKTGTSMLLLSEADAEVKHKEKLRKAICHEMHYTTTTVHQSHVF